MNFTQDINFGDYFEMYINTYKIKLAESTKKYYQRNLDILRGYFPNTTLKQTRKIDYQRFINDFGRNRAKETIQKLNVHIRGCVREAVNEGIVRMDFTRNVVINAGRKIEKNNI